jgi:uncharacterized protein
MKRLVLILACAGSMAWAEDPIRLLVITGSHPFDARLYGLFEGHPDIEWDKKTQSSKPCAAYTDGFAETYDVVLLYDFEMVITGEQKDAFVDAFGDGRGLIVLHHAICSHPGWEKFREIAGGQFFFQPLEGNPASEYTGNVEMRYEPADHPIAKGIEPFETIEEPYKYVYKVDDAKPFLTSDNEKSDEVVGWTHEYGDSRVATLIPGHGWQIFESAEYKKLLAQAIRWAAKRDVTAPAPK